MPAVIRFVALAAIAALSWLPAGHAQAPAKPAAAQAPAKPAAQAPVFKNEEIEQLVAPIALYPDPLVAQILMASTYPLEVVSAARWQKSNPGLKGKQLEDALQQMPWDPSVKSLTAFPQVLTMMDTKLDMTQKLGDAFLAQQKDVMSAIQRLRAKADQTGNLKSGKELTVEKKQEGGNTYITIEPTSPDVVYVPAYNPTVVYGTWPYPAYPPYYYYPPGYVPGAAFWGFAAGVAIGAAWNNGNCDWHGGDINISNTRTTNIQGGDRVKGGDRGQGGGKWQHSPEHRQGAGYRDQGSRDRYGGGQQRPGVDSRESFRGRAEQGRQEIARGGVSDRMAGSGGRGDLGGRPSQQPAGSFGDRGGAGSRPSQQLPGGGDRGGYGGGDRGGFGGVGGGGAQTRDFSNRGASSRQNSSFGGGGGGGSRAGAGGGGGGARAGGGGGGGRGGGGRR